MLSQKAHTERKPICDVETDVQDDGDNVNKYCEDMMRVRNDLFSKADQNIKEAQTRQMRDYDQKHHNKKVCHISLDSHDVSEIW